MKKLKRKVCNMKFQEYNKSNDVTNLSGILTTSYKDLKFNIGEEKGNVFIEWNWKEECGKVVPKTLDIMKTLRDNNIIPKRYNVCPNLARLEMEY